MLSGTKAERLAACQWLVEQDWATGDMSATTSRLIRVFTAKKVQTVVDSINLGLRMMKSNEPVVNVYGASAEAEREAQKAIRKAQFEADQQAKLNAPASGTEAAEQALSATEPQPA